GTDGRASLVVGPALPSLHVPEPKARQSHHGDKRPDTESHAQAPGSRSAPIPGDRIGNRPSRRARTLSGGTRVSSELGPHLALGDRGRVRETPVTGTCQHRGLRDETASHADPRNAPPAGPREFFRLAS